MFGLFSSIDDVRAFAFRFRLDGSHDRFQRNALPDFCVWRPCSSREHIHDAMYLIVPPWERRRGEYNSKIESNCQPNSRMTQGSMPTDGTLLLEHMPNGKQYLVTALSVFFSIGSVVSAVVGLLVIPSRSCPPAPAACNVETENVGWKYLLACLGLLVSARTCL